MADKVKALFEELMILSRGERERLRELLDKTSRGDFASPELEKAWIEEAESVSRAVHDGSEKTYPAEEVMRELRRIVAE